MAPHSSILAWGMVWTGEPGVSSVCGLQRVRHKLLGMHAHACAKNSFNVQSYKNY